MSDNRSWVVRGVLTKTHDATDAGMQLNEVSLLRDEAKVAVERFQQYGFTSHAPNESEVVVLFVGGSRDHGVAMSADHRAARLPGLGEGEVALYNANGDFVALCDGNLIDVATNRLRIRAAEEVVIETPRVIIKAPIVEVEGDIVFRSGTEGGAGHGEFVGNLHVRGNVTVDGDVRAGTVSLRGHIHSGVQAGLANTQVPVP